MAEFEINSKEIEQKLNQLGKDIQTFVGNIIRDDSIDDFRPLVDLTEVDDTYTVYIDLPGVKKQDIRIEWFNRVLTVSGNRKITSDTETYLRRERKAGVFQRAVTIPEEIPKKHIKASFNDGVLIIKMKRNTSNDSETEINLD